MWFEDEKSWMLILLNSLCVSYVTKVKTIITDPQSGEIICEDCGAVISDKTEEQGPVQIVHYS